MRSLFLILSGLAVAGSCSWTEADDHLASWVRTVRRSQPARVQPGENEPIPAPRPLNNPCPSMEELDHRPRKLTDFNLDITIVDRRLPQDCSVNVFQASDYNDIERGWCETQFNWVASDLYHQPAYFADPILERYGQSHHPCVQPWLSGAHFFGQFPIIPYKLALDHPYERVYTLGYYRPGSPTPLLGRRLPLRAGPAGFESAAWLAFIFLLP